jgi:hypothetical protein
VISSRHLGLLAATLGLGASLRPSARLMDPELRAPQPKRAPKPTEKQPQQFGPEYSGPMTRQRLRAYERSLRTHRHLSQPDTQRGTEGL